MTASVAAFHARMTEREMLSTLTDAIDAVGGAWYRVNDSRGQSMVGFPDLLAFVPYRGSESDIALIGFEIKTKTDRWRSGQADFLHYLSATVHCVGAFVRAGEPKPGEISLDEALSIITEGMR